MKYIVKVALWAAVIGCFIYLSLGLPAQDPGKPGAEPAMYQEQEDDPPPGQDFQNTDDDDLFIDDLYPLNREKNQKPTPSLSPKEEILWAFRLAESNPFL